MNPNQSTSGLQTVQQELTCPLCSNAGIATSWNPDVFNYGSGESMVKLTVDVPVRQCKACDFEYLDDEAERLRHEAVCRHLGKKGDRPRFPTIRADVVELVDTLS